MIDRSIDPTRAVASITALFSLVLPLAGLAAIPFVGLLLDRCHLSTTFFVVNTLGLLFGILSYGPHARAPKHVPRASSLLTLAGGGAVAG